MKKIIFASLLLFSTVANAQYIAGLSPVDLTSNLDQLGFVTESYKDSEQRWFWSSAMTKDSLDYWVEASSDNDQNLIKIHVTVNNVGENNVEALEFMRHFSSLVFKENMKDRKLIAQWLESNFNRTVVTMWKKRKIKLASPSASEKQLIIEAYD